MRVCKKRLRDIYVYGFNKREDLLEYIKDRKTILIAINAEKILKDDSSLHILINQNIGYADGSGAVMALRKKGCEAVKIPGVEFWLDIINKYYNKKSFYLIGSNQKIIEKTVERLTSKFKGLNIVGYRNGFLSDEDTSDLKHKIVGLKPDVVFVAQGSPKQEFLMKELFEVHPAIYMGLGGSFDIFSGSKKRAPRIFLKLNLEWLYRLLKEPVRFGRQRVLLKFYFLYLIGRL